MNKRNAQGVRRTWHCPEIISLTMASTRNSAAGSLGDATADNASPTGS